MTTLQSNGYQIALIEVLPTITAIGLETDMLGLNLTCNINGNIRSVCVLPPGSWSILGPGLSTLCSEEDWKKIGFQSKIDWGGMDITTGDYIEPEEIPASYYGKRMIRSHSMKPETTVIIIKPAALNTPKTEKPQ